MAKGTSLYDNGFYNISVTPTTDDLGRGGQDLFGLPLAFARQALFDRLGIAKIDFSILGNDHIPAVDEDLGSPVCADTNAKGVALILRPQCTVRLGNRTTFSGITTVRL